MTIAYRPNTKRTYTSAQKDYVEFCYGYGLQPVPASEQTILYYIAYTQARSEHKNIVGSGIKASSLKVYLSAIRSMHIVAGYPEPPISAPRVKLVLKAIHDNGPPPSQQAPITYSLLKRMISTLGHEYHHVMWHAVWCLGFFGGLRGAEYTLHKTPDGQHLSVLLELKHVQYSSYPIPHIRCDIPRTKTRPHGAVKVIGCSGTAVCAPCSLLEYLRLRHEYLHLHHAPALFVNIDATPVLKSQLNHAIKQAMSSLSLDPKYYSSHSLRAGVATQAGISGFGDWEIKELGSWASDAYITYIRPKYSHSLNYATRLVT